MQKATLPKLFTAKHQALLIINVFLLVLTAVVLLQPSSVRSALSSHIVISEIQITGTNTNDEFVELYNPTSSSVDLTGWRLARKTSGTSSANLVTNMSGTIPAHGYFLVAPTTYTGTPAADLNYSPAATRISDDNTVYLYSDAGITLVDKLAIGDEATDGEGTPAPGPGANESVERKAKSTSTPASMLAEDANMGNGEDTDNNSNDFILRTASQPQNAASAIENPIPSTAPSASASPSATPAASPSSSPSASPSASVNPSVAPSASPSVAPSSSPSASPSTTPSASPSTTPTPSASPSASIAPSASPSAQPSNTPTPSPTSTPKPRKTLACELKPQTFKFGRFEFTFRLLDCNWVIR